MTAYFVDTSTLARRYLDEPGADWVRSWMGPLPGHVVLLADVTAVEMLALLRNKQQELQLSPMDLLAVQTDFLRHVNWEYLTVSLNDEVVRQALQLVVRHSLRSAEAVQLATAWRARDLLEQPMVLMSTEGSLLAAAKAEGFATDDPRLHVT